MNKNRLNKKKTISILLIMVMLCTYTSLLSVISVFADMLMEKTITVSVVDVTGAPVEDVIFHLNSEDGEIIQANVVDDRYEISLDGYEEASIDKLVAEYKEGIFEVSGNTKYVAGVEEYSIELCKELEVNDTKNPYVVDNNGTYVMETEWDGSKIYKIYVSKDESLDYECSGNVNIEEMNGGIKLEYETPGVYNITFHEIGSNARFYKELNVELHINNTPVFYVSQEIMNDYRLQVDASNGVISSITIDANDFDVNSITDSYIEFNTPAVLNYTGDTVTYKVNNTENFSVDASGRVRCSGAGETIVTATSVSTRCSTSYTLTVIPVSGQVELKEYLNSQYKKDISVGGSIEVDVLEYKEGRGKVLKVVAENNINKYDSLIYTSSDTDKVTVDQDGTLHIYEQGEVTITCSFTSTSFLVADVTVSYNINVKPASMNTQVKFNGIEVAEGGYVEIDDDSSCFIYKSNGEGEQFTLPLEVYAKDSDGQMTEAVYSVQSDGISISGGVVSNPDTIERNIYIKYTVRIKPIDYKYFRETEYNIYIKVVGKKNINVDNVFYTITGLTTGADGNKWANISTATDDKAIVTFTGKTYSTAEDGTESKYQIRKKSDPDIKYATTYNMTFGSNEFCQGDKMHFMNMQDTSLITYFNREYFGVDLKAPVIKDVELDDNAVVTPYGIYSNDDITLYISVKDDNQNLYAVKVIEGANTIAEKIITVQDFVSGDENKAEVSLTVSKELYAGSEKDLQVVVYDAAGNTSSADLIDLVAGDDGYTNTLLIEEDVITVEHEIDATQTGATSIEKDGEVYFNDDIQLQVTLSDGATLSSGVGAYEVYVEGVYGAVVDKEFIASAEKKTEDTFYIDTADYASVYNGNEEGRLTIHITNIRDVAGNTIPDVVYNLYVDKKAPEAKILSVATQGEENKTSAGNYYNSEVVVKLNVSDGGAGAEYAELTIGTNKYESAVVNDVAEFRIPLNVSGDATLTVYDYLSNSKDIELKDVKDVYGNRVFTSSYVVVENTAPSTTFTPSRVVDANGKWYNHDVSVKVMISDDYGTSVPASNINTVEIFVNGELYKSATGINDKNYETQVVLNNEWINRVINNDGSYEIKVVAKDNSGNVSNESNTKTVYVDTVAPVISDITGVTEGSHNTGVVTVIASVKEKYYNEAKYITTADVKKTLDGNVTEYQMTATSANAENARAQFTFNEDGTYEVTIKSVDAAGNMATEKKISFVVDNTLPIANITGVTENSYYQDAVAATIEVIESNYATNDVRIEIIKELNGTKEQIQSEVFNCNNKASSVVQNFTEEGTYTIKVDAIDEAGNAAVTRRVIFTVDSQAPEITISCVSNQSAYKGDIIPEIVIKDNYYNTYSVVLTKTGVYLKDGTVDIQSVKDMDVTSNFITGMRSVENGVSGRFDTFEKIQSNDGVYALTVTATDLAGRTTTKSIEFSVNRYGSVYTFSQSLLDVRGAYLTGVEDDFVITEYNADRLVEDSVNIQIARDGSLQEDMLVSVSDTTDVNRGESGWYQYTYTIDKENFTKDGVYVVTVTSTDEAGNHSQTLTYDQLYVRFAIDNTKSELVTITGLDKNSYNANEIDIKYQVFDAVGIKEVRVYVNGDEVQRVNEFDDAVNYYGVVTIGEGMDQYIRFEIEDMAGNVTDSDNEDDINAGKVAKFSKTVTVSTNFFIRWYSDSVIFYSSIACILGVMVLIVLVVRRKRREV